MKDGDSTLAEWLEADADAATAREPRIDWEALGRLDETAHAEAKAGTLTRARVDELVSEARKAVPHDRKDVIESLEADLRALPGTGIG